MSCGPAKRGRARQANIRLRSLSVVFAAASVAPAWALEFDFYGSVRIGAEAVDPNGATVESYTGLRDAYSRIGTIATHALDDETSVYAKLELPFDTANLAVQNPFNQTEDIRIGKVGVRGNYGDVAVGRMWMPYYNAIAYPVDRFSSYYSGFATFTRFRLDDTVAYYTPSWNGLSAAASFSDRGGALEASGATDDRIQATLSYARNGLTLSGGLDDVGGANDARIWGASVMWQATDDLYIGAKYEQQDSTLATGYGADGDTAVNLFGAYTLGKNTLKAMIADVDNYGEQILHLGVDHQYRKDLKFFVEYYSEEDAGAIVEKRQGGFCAACEGGSVITAGLRYDFGASTNEQRQSSFATNASPIDFAFYTSLRVAAEAVDPNGATVDAYTGLRDAYSHIGTTADYALDDGSSVYGKLELSLDIANLAVQNPFNQTEDIRIGKVGVRGNYGDLAVGRMWMPYYNAIAYPVDRFSSYYSGFATFSRFRLDDTVAYYTPSWNGLSGAASFSDRGGALEASGATDDRIQATLSYARNGLTLSGGLDDSGGANDARIWGASMMWQATDDLYIGAKYEQQDSDQATGYGADGDSAVNLFGAYTLGKNTFKAMVADVDNYGEQILHLGLDHQYSKSLRLFVEYYSEEDAGAIVEERQGGFCAACEGGSVITAGLRYDFGAP